MGNILGDFDSQVLWQKEELIECYQLYKVGFDFVTDLLRGFISQIHYEKCKFALIGDGSISFKITLNENKIMQFDVDIDDSTELFSYKYFISVNVYEKKYYTQLFSISGDIEIIIPELLNKYNIIVTTNKSLEYGIHNT